MAERATIGANTAGGVLLAMELRHLRYFVAVAEELHFRHAAARLHIDESTLSKAIQTLEDRIGLKLLRRNRHHAELTEAGRFLLPRARAVLQAYEEMLTELEGLQRSISARLRVLYAPLCAGTLLAALLRECTTLVPDIVFELSAAPWNVDCGVLLAGEADILLYGGPHQPHSGIHATVLASCQYVVAVSTGHPWAGQEAVDIESLATERQWVTPLAALYAYELPPDRADATLRSDRADMCVNVETAIHLVAAGNGAITLPECAIALYARPDIRFVSLANGPTYEVLLANRQSDHSVAVEACLEVAGSLAQG